MSYFLRHPIPKWLCYSHEKEAEEFLADKFDLKNRLEGYVATAMAAALNPKIKLRATPKTNDQLFRETLQTIKNLDINSIQLEELPK